MKQRIAIIGAFLIHLSVLFTYAQSPDLKFKLVEDASGKPLGKIRNITQDIQGYMWFSGEGGKCIYRYDGNKLTTFSHDEADPHSLGSTVINSVYADNKGLIWIGTFDGLEQYNPATGIFTHYRHSDKDSASLSAGGVNPIIRDHQGRLWIGGDGLNQLDEKTGKFIHYRHDPNNPKSLSSNVIWNLYVDRQGVLWIAGGKPFYNEGKDWEEGGLNRLEADGTFTRFMHSPTDPHSLISNKVRAVFEDSRGTFWVGTSGDGLHTMDRKTGRFERHTYDPAHPEKLSRPPLKKDAFAFNNDQITFIQEDAMGSIWIGTMWSGLNRYDTLTKKITHFEASNGFPDMSAWNGFQSRDGVLWIATQENNLYRVDPFRKDIEKIKIEYSVNRFLEDEDGSFWVGTARGGLMQYDAQKRLIRQYRHDSSDPFSISDDLVSLLFQNQKDTLWVGSQTGMDLFNKKTGQFSRFPFPGDETGKSKASKRMNIVQQKNLKWITTWGNGLFRYDSKDHTFKHILIDPKDEDEFSANHLDPILTDSSGNLWIGSGKGILQFNPETEKFIHYRKDLKIPCLFKDSKGTLWAGTSRGLYRYDKTEDAFLPFFDSQLSLSNERIYGITEDASKNLWLSTPTGIVKITPSRDNQFIYGRRYGVSEFPAIGCIKMSRKGEIFVGWGDGFYSFFPEELADKSNFTLTVSSLSINNDLILPGKDNPIQKPIEEITTLELNYDQNNFSLSFTANDYREPEAIRYFTMLEGYDTWHDGVGEKRSDFFFVPPGTYTYKVRAYNANGTMAEKHLVIKIFPPWWKTWWAYSIWGMILMTALFAGYRLQSQRIINRANQKAQLKELAQAKEIQKAYNELRATQSLLIQSEKMASLGELTAGIAHEIQNPLNFVNNFSEVNTELIDEMKIALAEGNSEAVLALINDIRENEQKINYHGKRADGIVKGMLEHSRTSNGVKQPTEINKLTDEYLRLAYHGLRAKDKSFNATLQTDFDKSIGFINVISQDIGRVILNLFTNAFYSVAEKKTKAGLDFEPTVSVTTRKNNTTIEIRVKDNGMGIPKGLKDKIFQPFFTTKPTGQGTGLGLSLSYDIIKAHNGQLHLETEEGGFAEFIIHLPI